MGETPWRFDSSHPHQHRQDPLVTTIDSPESPPQPPGRLLRTGHRLQAWYTALEPARRWLKTTRGRRIFNVTITLIALGVTVLAARHFASTGWPLEHADPLLTAAAGMLVVLSYPLKALGWRRVFRPSEAPSAMSLAAANGAASVTGAALPGRFDEVVRIAVVRRYPSCPACVPTLAFSLFVIGLIDAAAMMPIAASAAATTDGPAAVTAGLSVVAATGLGAAAIVIFLPRLMASGRLIKYRIARWIHVRLISRPQAWKAGVLVLASWLLRSVGLYLLLAAMGMSLSFPLAIGFLCAAAAASALPIAPAAGAAAQAGGGAALLIAAGIDTNTAVDFAISAQALVIFAGIAVIAFAALWHAAERIVLRRALSSVAR